VWAGFDNKENKVVGKVSKIETKCKKQEGFLPAAAAMAASQPAPMSPMRIGKNGQAVCFVFVSGVIKSALKSERTSILLLSRCALLAIAISSSFLRTAL